MLKCLCADDLQGHSWVQWFTVRSHRIQWKVILTAMMSYIKGYRAKSAKGKVHGVKMREIGCKFPESSSSGVAQDAFMETCGNVCTAANRRIIETSSPEFFLGAGNESSLCLMCTKIQTPRRKADVQHKLCCLYILSVVNHSYHLWGDDENSPQIQVPRCQLIANLVSRTFNR